MRIAAVINSASGSVPADAESLFVRRAEKYGHTVQVAVAEGKLIPDVIKGVLETSPDVLAVWGGDGSVACALVSAGTSGPPVLALPGGTMNLVHRRLHFGQTDWDEILSAALSNPEPETIGAGRIENHLFFVAAMLGRLTRLTNAREAVRKGALIEAAETLLDSDSVDVSTRLRFTGWDRGQSGAHEASAGAVIIGGNKSPRLELAVINPGNVWDLVALGIDSLISGWREADGVDTSPVIAVAVNELENQPIPATIDGEPVTLPASVTARIEPSVARVLRARPSE